jgi:predicted N-acetyltransferase YhbS
VPESKVLKMQDIDFVQLESQHVPELARICFEAFKSVHDRHGSPRDFADVESAAKFLGLLTTRREAVGVAAGSGGRMVGSNFAWLGEGVAGIGPITVDPACHGRGIGRGLMEAVLELAAKRGVENTRLVQDSFHFPSRRHQRKLPPCRN